MFNAAEEGKTLRTTMKGGTGNGLEIMLDIQQDEYLPVWGETGTHTHTNTLVVIILVVEIFSIHKPVDITIIGKPVHVHTVAPDYNMYT